MLINIPRTLRDNVLADLRRRHAHAAERIGFLYGRLVGDAMIKITRYAPVADAHYVVDFTVGARINGDAIRAAMQSVLDTGDGAFHTHLHDWPGRPSFSLTDDEDLPKLIPAFRAVNPSQASGLILLSPDAAIADVWLPSKRELVRAIEFEIT